METFPLFVWCSNATSSRLINIVLFCPAKSSQQDRKNIGTKGTKKGTAKSENKSEKGGKILVSLAGTNFLQFWFTTDSGHGAKGTCYSSKVYLAPFKLSLKIIQNS